jgi:ribosomal protein S18 acetylase RimI-like enzyme
LFYHRDVSGEDRSPGREVVSPIVRRLAPDDYELVRDLRLRSLMVAPTAYGSTYERETDFSDEVWRDRLRPEGYPHFGCFDEHREMVGLVVAGPDEVGDGVGHLFAMWVEPHARGTGAADALVSEVVTWARSQGYSAVQLLVTEGNDRAEGMYRRNGFRRTGRSTRRDRDGLLELEMLRDLESGVT